MAVGSHPSGLSPARGFVPSRLSPRAIFGHTGTRRTPRTRIGAYVALTKPRIIELLLVSTVPTMILADQGLPSLRLIVATLVGGSLAAGGANAMNMYIDRDIDRLMPRTQHRPLVTGVVTPRAALIFAVVIEIVAFVELWWLVNLLSALLALSATLFYVFVYSLWLKRSSTRNIEIGGAAGAVPVLVGWAAVTNSLGWAPFVLFGVIVLWTPPHTWALATRYADDYRLADVPMLPAVTSLDVTSKRMLGYTVALWFVSLVVVPVADMGWIYGFAALALGAGFVASVLGLRRYPSPRRAMGVFGYSITYVTLLFGAIALDTLVRNGL
jgi:protoheme IX farnesyltransferase